MTCEQAEKVKRYCKRHKKDVEGLRFDDVSWRGVDFYYTVQISKVSEINKKRYDCSMYFNLNKFAVKTAVDWFNKVAQKHIKKIAEANMQAQEA